MVNRMSSSFQTLQVEGKTMYQMYFGDIDDFDSVFHNPVFIYSIDAANKMKPTFSEV